MTLGAVIFSRFNSSRLPGKALVDIGGRPMLGRVIDRARRIKGVDKVVVATSTLASDDVISAFAEAEGVGVYRGDIDNVALRAVGACEAFGLDAFSRICGDRPFFDPQVEGQLISLFHEGELDLATTNGQTKVPPGLTGEIVRTGALQSVLAGLSDYDQEHVTSYFYGATDRFKVGSIPPPAYVTANSTIRLVVDDAEDLARARAIAAGVPAGAFDMHAVVSLATLWDRQRSSVQA